MGSDDAKPGNVSDAINAAANLAKAVPIYDDALKPIASETGKALGTVGRVVNVCLAPVRGLVWSAEYVENWVETRVSKKLENEPEENIQTPDLAIAGPIIESLKFHGQKPEISEMFASLLASSMMKNKASSTHPSFVDKIRLMSAFDAQVFAYLAKQQTTSTTNIRRKHKVFTGETELYRFCNEDLLTLALGKGHKGDEVFRAVQASIETLVGLGLIVARDDATLTAPQRIKDYEKSEKSDWFSEFVNRGEVNGFTFSLKRSSVLLTQVGQNFSKSVFR
ncbi:protein of unknown function [Shimia gijangensis]|uniref:DUF4393 domain-containing protein n=1 Tax=Shimia gijangensis TaxID=1470563 RepID=A0A1M6DTW3_9RHOB|nr:DUF4393 domain-containing protein [Shimia gijangensis]SHI76696.1 protein of unknown function [Shimia gijangensis]